ATPIDPASADSAGGPRRGASDSIKPTGAVTTDSLFETLFSGISLTDDRARQARALLASLQESQLTQNTNTEKRRREVISTHPELRSHLDSVLLALPSNATDVETLRSRLSETLPGDGIYSRLFEGISLSPEREATARTATVEFQQGVRALMPPF